MFSHSCLTDGSTAAGDGDEAGLSFSECVKRLLRGFVLGEPEKGRGKNDDKDDGEGELEGGVEL